MHGLRWIRTALNLGPLLALPFILLVTQRGRYLLFLLHARHHVVHGCSLYPEELAVRMGQTSTQCGNVYPGEAQGTVEALRTGFQGGEGN